MNRLAEPATAETVVNRSRFLAHLVPAREFDAVQKTLRQTHPKANHIAYALRYLNQDKQVVEEFSDDGEPRGCAGMPILQVLRGHELIDAAVLVVRYFGGIKLGTGGMARAYGGAAKAAVERAELLPHYLPVTLRCHTPYPVLSLLEYAVSRHPRIVSRRVFDDTGARWHLEGPEEAIAAIRTLLERERIPFSIE